MFRCRTGERNEILGNWKGQRWVENRGTVRNKRNDIFQKSVEGDEVN